MQKADKEKVVADLTEKLRASETMIVADYRGLTMPQIDALRSRLIENGARFTVVKNTLTRRAAQEAGADALLALLEGPSAIAFVEAEGDAVAVAKALADSARDTKVLEIRGGVMQGRVISGSDVEELAKLPPLEVLRGQVLGAIIAPLSSLIGLVNAPLQNLYGLIDARIEQLQASGEAAPAEVSDTTETVDENPTAEEVSDTPSAESEEAPTETQEEETDGSS
jgi:large subunit ribosomal protein L10